MAHYEKNYEEAQYRAALEAPVIQDDKSFKTQYMSLMLQHIEALKNLVLLIQCNEEK